MNQPWIALIAVFCNVAAQLGMKLAGRADPTAGGTATWLSPWLIAAVVLYGCSFLLTVKVYAANPLSIASPAMAGCTFFLIALASTFLLGESMGVQKVLGICLVFAGIVLLTRA